MIFHEQQNNKMISPSVMCMIGQIILIIMSLSLMRKCFITIYRFKFFNVLCFVLFRNYFIVASRMVRPGQIYRVSVTVYKTKKPISVRASIQRNGVELSSDTSVIKEGIQETLLLLVRINVLFL